MEKMEIMVPGENRTEAEREPFPQKRTQNRRKKLNKM